MKSHLRSLHPFLRFNALSESNQFQRSNSSCVKNNSNVPSDIPTASNKDGVMFSFLNFRPSPFSAFRIDNDYNVNSSLCNPSPFKIISIISSPILPLHQSFSTRIFRHCHIFYHFQFSIEILPLLIFHLDFPQAISESGVEIEIPNGADVDEMLMATFEAEMKRQMVTSSKSKVASERHRIAPQSESNRRDTEDVARPSLTHKTLSQGGSIQTHDKTDKFASQVESIRTDGVDIKSEPDYLLPSSASSTGHSTIASIGKRKRATSPSDVADDEVGEESKRFRGASAPDNLGDNESLGVKIEPGDQGCRQLKWIYRYFFFLITGLFYILRNKVTTKHVR